MILDTRQIDRCRACGSSNLRELLDYGNMPPAGGFTRLDDPAIDAKAPLRLGYCSNCTLMQTLDTIPSDSIFRNYSYRSSASKPLVKHFKELARQLVREFSLQGKTVVEIGCNDGVMIKPLRSLGVKVAGVDPSDVALEASERDKWSLYNDYLIPDIARDVVEDHGKADLVVAFNVMAHTDNLLAFVMGVRELLKDEGVFIAEVQYQRDLLNKVQFDTVYHEHTCYYSLTAATHLLTRAGMYIWDAEPIETHSGSIRIYASPIQAAYRKRPRLASLLTAETMENGLGVKSFADRAIRARENIKELMQLLSGHGVPVAAYGAAGRATILLNWCRLGPDQIQYVVDASPLRIGKYVPGVKIPIRPLDYFERNQPSLTMITAWNYAYAIRNTHPLYTGRWLTPLPEVSFV